MILCLWAAERVTRKNKSYQLGLKPKEVFKAYFIA